MDRGQAVARVWDLNAERWTTAVREQQIPSRTAGTDRAIVDAVSRLRPGRVLDVGCGEGWLVRRLKDALGCAALGIDGSAPLVAHAKAADPGGDYRVLSYENVVARQLELGGRHDAAICNFALLGDSLAPLLAALRQALSPEGAVLIQTVHPWSACGEQAYVDGWREETFAAFGAGDWEPMPWYFRTLESWLAEIAAAGLAVAACAEPIDPASGKPLSLLLTCRAVRPGARG